MPHALMIGPRNHASDLIEIRLMAAGYRSLARASTATEAWRQMEHAKPDLIVLVGERPDISVEDLCGLSEVAEAPVLVATADAVQATACLGPAAALDGPFGLEEIHEAAAAAAPLQIAA